MTLTQETSFHLANILLTCHLSKKYFISVKKYTKLQNDCKVLNSVILWKIMINVKSMSKHYIEVRDLA